MEMKVLSLEPSLWFSSGVSTAGELETGAAVAGCGEAVDAMISRFLKDDTR
jgi:hypothetical protein